MAISMQRLSVYVITACAFLASGCSFNYRIPDVSLRSQCGEYVMEKKIDLVVNLCLTEEFRATKWEKHSMGDTFVIAIGDQLAKNASELSDILFKDVVVTNTPATGGTRRVDAIVTPRVAVIERSTGATAFGESIFTVVLEWKLEDAQNNMIWIDSIMGEGRAATGNVFTHKSNAEKQIEMLLKDLFSKSFQAIRASPEISQFAARKQP